MYSEVLRNLVCYLKKNEKNNNKSIELYNQWINESGMNVNNANDAYWLLDFINDFKKCDKQLLEEAYLIHK